MGINFIFYLFVSFISLNRIEADPTWSQVDSELFEKKFLRNDIPAVVNIATLVKRAHLLSAERYELEGRLASLREDRRHNDFMPGELYRFIQQQRTEIDSLRALRAEVDELKAKAEKIKHEDDEKERLRLVIGRTYFDVFSEPDTTTWNPITSELKYCLKKLTLEEIRSLPVKPALSDPSVVRGPFAEAASSTPLPTDRPFQWKVEILSMVRTNEFFLGIIVRNQGVNNDSFTLNITRHGWSNVAISKDHGWREVAKFHGWSNVAISKDHGRSNVAKDHGLSKVAKDEWSGWKRGDRGLFTYNPVERTLSLRLERDNELPEKSSDTFDPVERTLRLRRERDNELPEKSTDTLLYAKVDLPSAGKSYIYCSFREESVIRLFAAE